MQAVNTLAACPRLGLVGDRYSKLGPRQVTLMQWEHLPLIAQALGMASLAPGDCRRNLWVAGLELTGLLGREFFIGQVRLRATAPCPPCARLAQRLGPTLLLAMAGRGGICAQVMTDGLINLGDLVWPAD